MQDQTRAGQVGRRGDLDPVTQATRKGERKRAREIERDWRSWERGYYGDISDQVSCAPPECA